MGQEARGKVGLDLNTKKRCGALCLRYVCKLLCGEHKTQGCLAWEAEETQDLRAHNGASNGHDLACRQHVIEVAERVARGKHVVVCVLQVNQRARAHAGEVADVANVKPEAPARHALLPLIAHLSARVRDKVVEGKLFLKPKPKKVPAQTQGNAQNTCNQSVREALEWGWDQKEGEEVG